MSIQQFNGTATTSPTTVSFSGDVSSSILIQNVDSGAGSILVSFDGGTTFKTLANQWDFISIDANIIDFVIKTSAGSKSYESIVVIGGA